MRLADVIGVNEQGNKRFQRSKTNCAGVLPDLN